MAVFGILRSAGSVLAEGLLRRVSSPGLGRSEPLGRITGALVVLMALVAVPAVAQDAEPYADFDSGAYWAVPVTELAQAGVFAGTECEEGFCPDGVLDRATMAVWTVRVLDGEDPEPVTSTRFADVEGSDRHAAFIERFAELGVTQGCRDGSVFCPDGTVTRAEMAVFLTRAFKLPLGPEPGFSDVASDAWYADDVAALAASGITSGCGDGTAFCPGDDTTRAQMAAFLHRALALPSGEGADGTTEREADSTACANRDRTVLATLYRSMDGSNWRRDTNWLSDEALDSWHGIQTDTRGCITHISLSDNRLNGSIPADLGRLLSLRVLDLSWNNDISGIIPAELGNLVNLEILNLDDQTGQHDRSQGLSGTIPAELGQLANLLTLNLSWHLLDAGIPTELGDLSNLEQLELRGNSLSGNIPAELGGLSKLEVLALNHNDLSGTIPKELGQLSALTLLSLTANELSGSIPAEFGNLASIKNLWLSLNNLTGTIPKELSQLSRLEDLDLHSNFLSGTIPAQLGMLPALEDLDLSDNDLSGTIPAELGMLPALEDLDLSDNDLSGTIPAELGMLRRLERLNLRENLLSGDIPSALGDLTRLNTLYLSGNELTGCIPDQFRDLNRTDIERLNLPYCDYP